MGLLACTTGIALIGALASVAAQAATLPAPAWQAQVEQVARDAALAAAPSAMPPRVEVEVGAPDPRLRLAPCARTEATLSPGSSPWGRTRVGLRCVDGAPWSIFVPVTVRALGLGLAVAAPLPAGTLIEPQHLVQTEVDLASGLPLVDESQAVGRVTARAVPAGSALRAADLRARQWFAAGETVQLVVQGRGFSVSSEGQAMSPGLEGQTVRVRTESGRLVQGRATGGRVVEVPL